MRVGLGYDVHRFKKGKPLILGGVAIPHGRGLDGHSDADVVIHALMDALLGAAGLPDIGALFPNTDPACKNISSLLLLKNVSFRLGKENFVVGNVDVTVIAEQPKIAPYIDGMKEQLSEVLGISRDRVGVKATTNEGMGFIGRGEGIAALAVAALGPAGKKKKK
ncbi:MAG: 2-C-methyl-D-erythritol 2,4-cyclodiphosphate synthase [Endomicrobiales bacterium]